LPKATELLAAALAGARCPEPVWSDLEWRIARAVAVIHGVSPLLSKHLDWTGPRGWREFLQEQRTHTATRYGRIKALLAQIDMLAAHADVAFIPLKGEALHAIGIYAAGDRPMADIDLLVRPCDLSPLSQAVTGLGYRPLWVTAEEHTLVPVDWPRPSRLGEHADNGVTIELHTRIARPLPVRNVDITEQLWPPAPQPGRNDYRSLSAMMGHLLMHAAVNMQTRLLRMVQLHDIALLAPRLSADDWIGLLAPGEGRAVAWWAMPPLQLTSHYYPEAIPALAISTAASGCTALLRRLAHRLRLSDVSASNLRRSVFPALSWVGSVPEAAYWVGNRLRSGFQALRGGSVQAAIELQPWLTASHRHRLLEVVLGRPRPETLLVVNAALEDMHWPAPDQTQPRAA
jgi:hypothetical protein